MARSWEEKFRGGPAPHVALLDKPFGGLAPGQRLFIASPPLIAERIAKVRRGRTLGVEALRTELARRHGADATCALTTGIFLRIVAERALEQLAMGKRATPFWRVIDPDSALARKLSCGPDFIRARRAEEAQ